MVRWQQRPLKCIHLIVMLMEPIEQIKCGTVALQLALLPSLSLHDWGFESCLFSSCLADFLQVLWFNVTALSQGHWSFMFSMDSCSAMNINALLTCWVFLNGKWVDQAGCVPHLRFSVEHCINNNNHHHHLDYLRVLLHLLQIIWSIKNNLQMQYYKTQT